MARSQKVHRVAFKAKVELATVKQLETVSEPASQHKVHTTQIHQWKKQLLDGAEVVFNNPTGRRTAGNQAECSSAKLYQQIRRRNLEQS